MAPKKFRDIWSRPFERKIHDSYPLFFADVHKSSSESTMGRSQFLEHGSGWDHIIENLCSRISSLSDESKCFFKFEQIKEKFGILRIYFNEQDFSDEMLKEIRELISNAEKESSVTCESCGAPGILRNEGWLSTLCDFHHRKARRITN